VSSPRVTGLSVTAIKGTRLRSVETVRLEDAGAVGNRRFFVIDERDRMVNAKVVGELQQIVAETDGDGTLRLELPGGRAVSGAAEPGAELSARFFSRPRRARLINGPFAEAISEACGRPLRLVEDRTGASDRGVAGGVSLVSRASLQRLAQEAGAEAIDGRRFRMLVEIEGIAAHEEDGWVGRTVRIGEARVRFGGHVGRCLVTSRHPDSGIVDLPTLELLGAYRGSGAVESTEPLPFGIYGRVVAPGELRLGDPLIVE
jgi:uncharacterized protein YcbX